MPPTNRGRNSKRKRDEARTPPTNRGRNAKAQGDPDPDKKKTVCDVCEEFGLRDVDWVFSESDFTNLTGFNKFKSSYWPRIKAENPEAQDEHLLKLMKTKWGEFEQAKFAKDSAEKKGSGKTKWSLPEEECIMSVRILASSSSDSSFFYNISIF